MLTSFQNHHLFFLFDAYDVIEYDIDRIDTGDDIIICGDFNSYSNIEIDYVIDPPGNDIEFYGLPDVNELYLFNNANFNEIKILHDEGLLKRFSLDSRPMNKNGRDLIDLCKSRGLLIINGRISDDKGKGEFTRYDHQDAPSVVDYMIASAKTFKQIDFFKVHPKLPESDHLPLIFTVKCKRYSGKDKEYISNELNSYEPLQKIKWQASDLDEIKMALQDEISMRHLNIFYGYMCELQNPSKVGLALTDYIKQAIIRVCPSSNYHVKSKRRNCPSWFDTDLRLL